VKKSAKTDSAGLTAQLAQRPDENRSALDLGTAAIGDIEDFDAAGSADSKLAKSSNLSDLPNAAAARTNIGLGTGNSPSFVRVDHSKPTGGAYDATSIAATFGDLSVGHFDSTFIIGNTVNVGYGFDAHTDLIVNYRGYAAGTTRGRGTVLNDGTGGAFASFNSALNPGRFVLGPHVGAKYSNPVTGAPYGGSNTASAEHLMLIDAPGVASVCYQNLHAGGFFGSRFASHLGYERGARASGGPATPYPFRGVTFDESFLHYDDLDYGDGGGAAPYVEGEYRISRTIQTRVPSGGGPWIYKVRGQWTKSGDYEWYLLDDLVSHTADALLQRAGKFDATSGLFSFYYGIAGVPTETTGSSTLASDFDITAASGTYVDTGLGVTLPTAGTYLVIADVQAQLNISGGSFAYITVQLRNTTDGVYVANTTKAPVLVQDTNRLVLACATVVAIITVASPKTIKLYAARSGTTPTYAISRIQADANGATGMRFVKLGV
jgi:hypothetical protein